MKMKTIPILILMILLGLSLSACGGTTASETNDAIDSNETATENEAAIDMIMKINDTEVSVEWEENESVEALMELAGKEPLTIQMSMYGGFEQVGSIGTSLTRNDQQTTTNAGDIVLYSGNQIVVFC